MVGAGRRPTVGGDLWAVLVVAVLACAANCCVVGAGAQGFFSTASGGDAATAAAIGTAAGGGDGPDAWLVHGVRERELPTRLQWECTAIGGTSRRRRPIGASLLLQ